MEKRVPIIFIYTVHNKIVSPFSRVQFILFCFSRFACTMTGFWYQVAVNVGDQITSQNICVGVAKLAMNYSIFLLLRSLVRVCTCNKLNIIKYRSIFQTNDIIIYKNFVKYNVFNNNSRCSPMYIESYLYI